MLAARSSFQESLASHYAQQLQIGGIPRTPDIVHINILQCSSVRIFAELWHVPCGLTRLTDASWRRKLGVFECSIFHVQFDNSPLFSSHASQRDLYGVNDLRRGVIAFALPFPGCNKASLDISCKQTYPTVPDMSTLNSPFSSEPQGKSSQLVLPA